jgi:hypothetical protein
MNKIEAKKYQDYPEGSGGKKMYDKYYLPFQEYLDKYYKITDLSRWDYINSKFVLPLFDGTTWKDYLNFLSKVKPKFLPDENKKNEFWLQVKNDVRFSLELKHFFSFLYSVNFYKSLSFEEWLNASNWMHPWYTSGDENLKSILELLKYNHSENYLKVILSELSIF